MRAAIRETVSGLPAAFWILFSGSLLNRLGAFVQPFLVLWLTGERGLSVADAGLVAAVWGAGAVLSAFVGGLSADHLGRKATLLVGLGGAGAAMLGLGFAAGLPEVVAFAFLVSFFSELCRPALQAAVADVVPPKDRARAYGLLYWSANLGFSIAPIVASLVAKASWLALFVIDALTIWGFALVVLFGVRESRPVRAAGAPAGPGLLAALTDGNLLAFSGLSFFAFAVFFQSFATLPLDMRAHGVDELGYGLLMASNGLLIILLQVPLTRAMTRRDPAHVLAASSLLVGVGFGLNALAGGAPVYLLGIALWTLGEIGIGPATPAIVAALAPAELRGRYQGIAQTAAGLAHLAGPAVGALVLERHGGGALWGGCLAVCVVVALGHLAAAGARRRRLEALTTPSAGSP